MNDFSIGAAGTGDMRLFREWADDEQWNPGDSDVLAFHAADPEGFLLGRLDGEPVASVSAVRYGPDHGFLGFYIARPPVRGKGYGIRMWRAAMERLEGRTVGLDGVVDQQDNYRASGFRAAYRNVRHHGAVPEGGRPDGIALVDARTVPFDVLAAYDRRFFPARRDAFLSLWLGLPGHTSLAAVRDGEVRGLGVLRPSSGGSRIGPLYAASEDIALALVTELAAGAADRTVGIDAPDANPAAIALVERLGLEPSFECARMYRGRAPEVDTGGIFGTTTVELG
jgi:GNAT superfamily N-acetyltransferase